nr:gustatory receptor 10 [Pieris rapae]
MKISTVKGILYFRLAVGNYWECSSSKTIQFLCKCYCVVYISVATYVYFLIGFEAASLKAKYDVNLFFFFIINGIFGIWNKQEYFTKFYSGIKTIDKIIHFTKRKSASLVAYITLVVIKSGFNLTGHILINERNGPFFANQMAEISKNISNLPSVMIYEMLWSRMACLRKWLNSKLIYGNLDEKQFCLRKFLHLYKTLLDNVTKVHNILVMQACMELVYYFITLLADVHSSILLVIRKGTWELSLSILIISLTNVVLWLMGPLFLELTLNEYEEVMSLISTELMQCKDEAYREQILTTLEYLEVRPHRYTTWRIISMNLKQVITVFDLLVTYIIVLLSFQL